MNDFVSAAAIGIARFGSDGHIADANPRMVQILGRSALELARMRWEDLTHPHDRAQTRPLLQELWGGERTEMQVEQRVLRPDGSWVWVSFTAAPLLDAGGRIDSLVASAQDITAQKLTDEALRRSELRFRRLIEKLPTGAYTCDRDGLITYYNDRAVQLWGRAPKLHHPDDRYCGSFRLYTHDGAPMAHDACWMARALREERDFDGEEVHIERPDGTRVAALAHASPLRDEAGEIVGSLNILVDISDRKRAELVLVRSELRFTQFMEHLRGLAWIKDFEGRYLFMNAAAEVALAREPAVFIGRTDDEIFPPTAAAQFRENDRKVLATGKAFETIEQLELADGMHYWMVSKFPIPGPDGYSTRCGGIAIDVTESVRSREALLDADRRKDEFLATLSHELRNPLAPIRNALEILHDPSRASASIIELLERQVRQMVRLVDDLLEVSRVSRGAIELRREPVDVGRAVRAALETSAPGIETGRHALEVSLPAESVVVDADPVRLNQILVNLLNNAARYTPEGGHIRIALEKQGDEAVVYVRDDGLGIPAEALDRIFEPFTHVDHPGGVRGGLGIGLALVGQLVRMHGGSVEARSDGRGRGSEFVVKLPLSREPLRPDTNRGDDAAPPARAAYAQPILVVDDNRDAAETLAVLLRARGMQVEIVHDGESALAALPRVKPGAVLLDLGMPGMDGLEVARRMRSTPDGRSVLLIALTGWGQVEMRGNSRAAGFDHHCVKPVEIEELQSLLVPPNA
jgi:two-component system CheB/CheR fusion protein